NAAPSPALESAISILHDPTSSVHWTKGQSLNPVSYVGRCVTDATVDAVSGDTGLYDDKVCFVTPYCRALGLRERPARRNGFIQGHCRPLQRELRGSARSGRWLTGGPLRVLYSR